MSRQTNKARGDAIEKILQLIEQQTFLCSSDYDDLVLINSINNRMLALDARTTESYFDILQNNQTEVNELGREIVANDKRLDYDQLYHALFQNSFDGIILYDIESKSIIDSNHATSVILGYSRRELENLHFTDIIYSEEQDWEMLRLILNIIRQIEMGSEFNFNHAFKRKSGEIFPINVSLLPVISRNKKHVLFVLRDLKEIVDKERQIRESNEGFQSIFQMNPLGISVANMDNVIVEINQSCADILGYEVDELVGMSFSELYPKNYSLENKYKVEQLIQGDIDVIELEKQYVRKTGEIIMCHIWVNILHRNNEQFFITCIQDITEQHQLNLQTKEREERYSTLFNKSLEGIVVLDFQKNEAIDVNPSAEKLFGSNRENLLASSMPQQSPEYQKNGRKSLDILKEKLTQFRNEEKEISFEWQFIRSNTGELFDAIVTFSPITLNGIQSAVMFVNDLTEQKKAEKKISQQLKELDKKNKQLKHYIHSNLELESFAYVASHDLKTPLRSIGSFTQLLDRRYSHLFDDDAKDYMDFIMTNVKSMSSLIQDLLSYSRVNTKELDVEDINLNILVADLIEIHNIPEHQDVEFLVDELPMTIMGNRTKLKQIFQNLVSNAIKFKTKTDIPKIEINYQDNGEYHQFEVRDNGIGIEDEFKEKIFLVFQRLHTKVEYEGSGIGLAICKKIVEQHQGEIWVESEFGKGSSFIFSIKKELDKLA